MGSSRDYICPKCGYSEHVCGGREIGMVAVLKTYTCNNCQTLSDLQISEYGEDYADMIDQESVDISMEELRCPKCSYRMKADPMTEVLWD